MIDLSELRIDVERQHDNDNGGSWTSDFQEGVDYVFELLGSWDICFSNIHEDDAKAIEWYRSALLPRLHPALKEGQQLIGVDWYAESRRTKPV